MIGSNFGEAYITGISKLAIQLLIGSNFGEAYTIVAIKNTDGKFQTAFQNLTIADKPLENLAFKETTLPELKQELEKLN